jgi:hypothetical protein
MRYGAGKYVLLVSVPSGEMVDIASAKIFIEERGKPCKEMSVRDVKVIFSGNHAKSSDVQNVPANISPFPALVHVGSKTDFSSVDMLLNRKVEGLDDKNSADTDGLLVGVGGDPILAKPPKKKRSNDDDVRTKIYAS